MLKMSEISQDLPTVDAFTLASDNHVIFSLKKTKFFLKSAPKMSMSYMGVTQLKQRVAGGNGRFSSREEVYRS